MRNGSSLELQLHSLAWRVVGGEVGGTSITAVTHLPQLQARYRTPLASILAPPVLRVRSIEICLRYGQRRIMFCFLRAEFSVQWQHAVLVGEPLPDSSRVTRGRNRRKQNGSFLELQLHSLA